MDPELDEQTLADTLEGLTDLNEIVAAIVRSSLEDEALVVGLKDLMADMERRLQQLQDRAAQRRRFACETMVDVGIKTITAPDFTVSTRSGSPALVVVDEKAIPAQFFEPRAPRLNRQALLAELKQGAAIAGVQLSNPAPVLSVRIR